MIKVYLLVGKLPLYRDMIRYSPKGIEYFPKKSNYGKDITTYYSSKTHSVKRLISSVLLEKFSLPRMVYVKTNADLIHSNRGILVLNKKPWVIDVDHVGYFFGPNILNDTNNTFLKKLVSRFLKSEYCKKIICWSNAAKTSVDHVFKGTNIEEKSEVLYPAVNAPRIKHSKHDNLKILYVSSSFSKGGIETLEAFRILSKMYDDIEFTFKCDVPNHLKKEYEGYSITFHPYKTDLMPREQLIENFYFNSDIFVYPTSGDLFGLGLLDAMSASLPIVTTKQFAIPEIVASGKGGFLIEPKYVWYDKNYMPLKNVVNVRKHEDFVKDIVEKTSVLIDKKKLREKMGKYNRLLVEKGKFSIKERNNRLSKIYEESLQ